MMYPLLLTTQPAPALQPARSLSTRRTNDLKRKRIPNEPTKQKVNRICYSTTRQLKCEREHAHGLIATPPAHVQRAPAARRIRPPSKDDDDDDASFPLPARSSPPYWTSLPASELTQPVLLPRPPTPHPPTRTRTRMVGARSTTHSPAPRAAADDDDASFPSRFSFPRARTAYSQPAPKHKTIRAAARSRAAPIQRRRRRVSRPLLPFPSFLPLSVAQGPPTKVGSIISARGGFAPMNDVCARRRPPPISSS